MLFLSWVEWDSIIRGTQPGPPGVLRSDLMANVPRVCAAMANTFKNTPGLQQRAIAFRKAVEGLLG